MTICDPCISISTGTLSPDQRVNYAYGMVLGLDEFLTEQQYFLNKDYLHERALHGYGTVYGLQATTSPSGTDDYTVQVAPGMAIDQWGREVVVRSPQCARLGPWLGAQEQANPGTIAANMGPSGEFTVYVVASYADCLDDLVPLPGQPCSSSAQTIVAARLRDAWNIELRWHAPEMESWDTDRRLARLLSSVQIVAGLDPTLSSEADIIAAVRALPGDIGAGPADLWPLVDWPPGSPPNSPSGPVVYRLPAETAADALDRIFTIWVTEVRQLLKPDLTQPADDADPAVLLSTITFTMGPLSSPPSAEPAIASCDEPDDTGRPYVLHTRLIQELRILAQASAATAGKAQELATLTGSVDGQGQGQLILTAWFHLAQPVALTQPVHVQTRSGASGTFTPSAPPDPSGAVSQFSDVWILTPTSQIPVVDQDQVAVAFAPAEILVGDPGTTLADRIARGLVLLDTLSSGEVTVYGTVDAPPAVAPARPAPAVLEFVTVTLLPATVAPAGSSTSLEFWFHPQPQWPTPQVQVIEIAPDAVLMAEEPTGPTVPASALTSPTGGNVWNATFQGLSPTQQLYRRIVFSVGKFVVEIDGTEKLTLPDWMTKANIRFEGWDPDTQTITTYVRLARPS